MATYKVTATTKCVADAAIEVEATSLVDAKIQAAKKLRDDDNWSVLIDISAGYDCECTIKIPEAEEIMVVDEHGAVIDEITIDDLWTDQDVEGNLDVDK